jgi:hypothetical protein
MVTSLAALLDPAFLTALSLADRNVSTRSQRRQVVGLAIDQVVCLGSCLPIAYRHDQASHGRD